MTAPRCRSSATAPGLRDALAAAGAGLLAGLLALSSCAEAPADSRIAATSPAPDRAPADAPGAPPAGWFTDISALVGLDFVHQAGRTAEKHLPETMGAGAALADLDGDGRLDIYLLQGGPLPGTAAHDSATRLPVNRLYLQAAARAEGLPRFRDATQASGDAAHDGYAMGLALGDIDADGDLDLYVTNFGPDVLLRNDGAGQFRDITTEAGLGDERWTTAALFFDADGDGLPELFVTGYVQIDPRQPLHCGDVRPGWRSYCHPDVYPGLPPRYWRNLGAGRFEEATEAAGLATTPDAPGKGLGAISLDLDDDGWLDLYVANDSVENRLWRNRGNGRFEDATLRSGTGVNEQGRTEAGMGLASGDVDGDRDIDIFVTNFDDESNTLYRNDGAGLFSDVTAAAGLDAPSRLWVGFGTVLEDLDLDGDLDLAVANGHIIDNIELYHDGKSSRQVAQLFRNDGRGRFAEVTAHAGDLADPPRIGRGLYAGDVDGDGAADLLLTETDGPARLLRNQGPPDGAAGAALRILGLPPGSRVTVTLDDGRVLLREFGTQTSYFGAGAMELLIGLGSARATAVRVRAPGTAAADFDFDPPLASCTLSFGGFRHASGPPAAAVLPLSGSPPR